MQGISLSELFAQQVHVSRLQGLIRQHADDQLALLNALQESGAPVDYRYRILNHLIRYINDSTHEYELTDEVSDAHADLLIACMHPQPLALNHHAKEKIEGSLVIYRFDSSAISVHEQRDVLVQAGGTGYRTWEAALALGDFLIKNPLDSACTAIELGAGTGFLSLVLKTQGINVITTDGDDEILARLDRNLHVLPLWWGDKSQMQHVKNLVPAGHAVVIAADVWYDSSVFTAFISTVQYLLKDRPGFALVSTTLRNEDTYAQLPVVCRELGVEIHVVAQYPPASSNHFYIPEESRIEIVKLVLAG